MSNFNLSLLLTEFNTTNIHNVSLDTNNVNDCDYSIHLINTNVKKIDDLIASLQTLKDENTELLIRVNKKKTEFEKNTCKTISELISKINNEHQIAILERIKTNFEDSKIYLNNYQPNTDTSAKLRDLIGTVFVFGTFNEKKQSREQYEIKIYNILEGSKQKNMFWCSCADHKFNSTKKNIMCKHICFLICKIGKFLKPEIFQTKKLSQDDLAILLTKLESTGDIWKDLNLTKISNTINIDFFKQFTKEVNDCCPICFDDLNEDNKPELVSCPTCKNYIHSDCISVWLEQKTNCVLCKSDIWKHYKPLLNNRTLNINV